MTTARKIAWNLIHAELRRRLGDDTTVVTSAGDELHPELEWVGLLLKEAREAKIDDFDILLEMAGFVATYAQMLNPGNDPLEVALLIAARVMAEEPVDCPVTGAEHDWDTDPKGRNVCTECGFGECPANGQPHAVETGADGVMFCTECGYRYE